VGLRVGHGAPTQHAARPVALACHRVAGEHLVAHGLALFPGAVLVTVIRDAGGGAAAGAGDDEQARVRGNEIDQGLQIAHARIVRALPVDCSVRGIPHEKRRPQAPFLS
jgi:hypothetical protein